MWVCVCLCVCVCVCVREREREREGDGGGRMRYTDKLAVGGDSIKRGGQRDILSYIPGKYCF